jgi:hypothetical protein
MSLEALAGRTFAPTSPFEVTPERVSDFATSTGGSYSGGAVPVTFPIVIAFDAIRALVDDPTSGLSLDRIVHGEQRFSYHRPVRPGDVLTATLSVETVRSIGGSDYIRTVTEIHDSLGELVVTARATLIHRPAPHEAPPSGPVTLPPPRSGDSR